MNFFIKTSSRNKNMLSTTKPEKIIENELMQNKKYSLCTGGGGGGGNVGDD
jgi:hypothetical protein